MEKILLITGCVQPAKDAIYLKINDSKIRLEQYLKTIDWAINESNFDIIIFCENSSFDLNYKKYENLKCKKFEYLTFQGDNDKSSKYGKGYGEGEIIKYAIENSKYLKNSDYFYKITGRLTIKNINNVLKTEKEGNLFLKFLYHKEYIDTRFYKVETKTYEKYLLLAYENVRDSEGKTLENIFFKIMKNNKIKYHCFNTFPILCGISGSTGIKYKMSNFKIFIYNLLCKFNLYNSNIISYMILKLINK